MGYKENIPGNVFASSNSTISAFVDSNYSYTSDYDEEKEYLGSTVTHPLYECLY